MTGRPFVRGANVRPLGVGNAGDSPEAALETYECGMCGARAEVDADGTISTTSLWGNVVRPHVRVMGGRRVVVACECWGPTEYRGDRKA